MTMLTWLNQRMTAFPTALHLAVLTALQPLTDELEKLSSAFEN